MRRLSILLLSVIFSNLSTSRAGLVFETPHLDITAPVTSTQTEAIFPFRVDGATSIKSVKSSCECTVGKSNKVSYQPGERGEIRAIFTHGERVGEQFKTLTIRTDEPGVGPQKVSFKVVIPRVVEVSPVALFWTRGAKIEMKEIQIVFPDGKFKPVGIGIPGKQKNIDAKLTCVESGKRYVLTVSPRSTAESWKEELSIEMDFGPELGVRKQICYAYVK